MKDAERFLGLVSSILKVQKISGDFLYDPFDAFHIFDPSKKMVNDLGIYAKDITTVRREHDDGLYPWEHSFVIFGIHFRWISKSMDPFCYAPNSDEDITAEEN